MGILNDLLNKLHNSKYEKMRDLYVKSFKESGILGSVQKIQEYIQKNNILSISDGHNYGDSLDSIEEIFSDNESIINEVKNIRSRKILDQLAQLDLSKKLSPNFVVNNKNIKDFVEQTLNFNRHYNGKSKEFYSVTEIDQQLNNLEHLYQTIKDMDSSNEILLKVHKIVSSYSINSINQTDDLKSKQFIFYKTNQLLETIASNAKDKENFEKDKDNFMDTLEAFSKGNTSTFVRNLKDSRELKELGVKNIPGMHISYINANDPKFVEISRQQINDKKDARIENPTEFSESDFALVRTTEFFPDHREMEIVDELNCRCFINNFLTSYLADLDLREQYGENYKNIMMNTNSIEGKEIYNKRNELRDKYGTLTTAYRSTKHFTLNGLVSSHEYGSFDGNPYIIIEPLNEHINDKNIKSLNEADTYFQISREEPFKLSDKAVLMMPIVEFLHKQDNKEFIQQISQYDLTLFSGNEKEAVDIKLFEMGYLPEEIGKWGYDISRNRFFSQIIDEGVKNVCEKHNLDGHIHFYSDIKKEDDNKSMQMAEESNEKFVNYMFDLFDNCFTPDKIEYYKEKALTTTNINSGFSEEELSDIVNTIGKANLIEYIQHFNDKTRSELDKNRALFESQKNKNQKDIDKHKDIE